MLALWNKGRVLLSEWDDLDFTHRSVSSIIEWLGVNHFSLGLSFCVYEARFKPTKCGARRSMYKVCTQGCVQNHCVTVNGETKKLC